VWCMRVCKLMCVRASAPRVCVHLKSMCVLCVYAGANCQENDAETTCTSHERASKCDTEVRTTRTHTHTRAHTHARALSLLFFLSRSLFSLSLSPFSLSLFMLPLSLPRVYTRTHARARAHTDTNKDWQCPQMQNLPRWTRFSAPSCHVSRS
jgi:hypothetical protein